MRKVSNGPGGVESSFHSESSYPQDMKFLMDLVELKGSVIPLPTCTSSWFLMDLVELKVSIPNEKALAMYVSNGPGGVESPHIALSVRS